MHIPSVTFGYVERDSNFRVCTVSVLLSPISANGINCSECKSKCGFLAQEWSHKIYQLKITENERIVTPTYAFAVWTARNLKIGMQCKFESCDEFREIGRNGDETKHACERKRKDLASNCMAKTIDIKIDFRMLFRIEFVYVIVFSLRVCESEYTWCICGTWYCVKPSTIVFTSLFQKISRSFLRQLCKLLINWVVFKCLLALINNTQCI